MTEDEAKTKWCPFARVGSFESGLGSINRGAHADGIVRRGILPEEALCIGSACMAWRDEGRERGAEIGRLPATPNSTRPDENWRWEADQTRPSMGDWVHRAPGLRVGSCGLAGRPS